MSLYVLVSNTFNIAQPKREREKRENVTPPFFSPLYNGAQLVVIGRLDGVVPGRWHVALMSPAQREEYYYTIT